MSVKPAGLSRQFAQGVMFLFAMIGMITIGLFVLSMIWTAIEGFLTFDPKLIVSHIFAGFVGAWIAGMALHKMEDSE